MNSSSIPKSLRVRDALLLASLRDTSITAQILSEIFHSVDDDFEALIAEPERCSYPQVRRLLETPGLCEVALSQIELWLRGGISYVTFFDKSYPEILRAIHKPPLVLFYRGIWRDEIFAKPSVAIVGSRKADSEGCALARRLGGDIASYGGCVVSGLAYGIDAAAHLGALDDGQQCSTVAILGNGLNDVYPALHRALAERIVAQGGLVCSQFEPSMKPFPHNFIDRNRIIAGLSQAVVVMQAAEKSGSLATARFALEEGREVLVVPGSVLSGRNSGGHRLLKQGAALLEGIADLQEILPALRKGACEQPVAPLTQSMQELLTTIRGRDAVTVDELIQHYPLKQDLQSLITNLELEGYIARGPGECLMAL
jgi:DNA processing protein